mmetsp:Transcript_1027/g.2455  ORF Transcript_1027/g.2455 Transcript_1027/m.2455 type:complete len:226 (+) Transcript_1027:272-949(+)
MGVGVFQEGDVKGSRHVVHGGDFVGAGAFRAQFACWYPWHLIAAVHQLLCGEPAHALHKRALNLPNVHARVNALANIHHNVCGQHAVVPREHIHLHQRGRRPRGVVHERTARFPVKLVLIHGKSDVAQLAQGDSREICRFGQLLERHVRVFFPDRLQTSKNRLARLLCGFGVHVGPHGRGGGRCVGDLVGCAFRDVHVLNGNLESVCGGLNDFCVQPLAHLHAAV